MSEVPRMKRSSLNSRLLHGLGVGNPQERSVRLSFRPRLAAPTLSFLTLVQGSLEKLSVSEISMSSPYSTPVRSFLTCQQREGRVWVGRRPQEGLVQRQRPGEGAQMGEVVFSTNMGREWFLSSL